MVTALCLSVHNLHLLQHEFNLTAATSHWRHQSVQALDSVLRFCNTAYIVSMGLHHLFSNVESINYLTLPDTSSLPSKHDAKQSPCHSYEPVSFQENIKGAKWLGSGQRQPFSASFKARAHASDPQKLCSLSTWRLSFGLSHLCAEFFIGHCHKRSRKW